MKKIKLDNYMKYISKQNQDLFVIEEMSELTKEFLKRRRGNCNRPQIVSEIADIYLTLEIYCNLYGISDDTLIVLMEQKLDRMKEKSEIERVAL